MHLAVMVGRFVKHEAREWYPSTTRPLLPTMTNGLGILRSGMCYRSFTTLPCEGVDAWGAGCRSE